MSKSISTRTENSRARTFLNTSIRSTIARGDTVTWVELVRKTSNWFTGGARAVSIKCWELQDDFCDPRPSKVQSAQTISEGFLMFESLQAAICGVAHRAPADSFRIRFTVGNTLGITLPVLAHEQLIYHGLNWTFRWPLSPPHETAPEFDWLRHDAMEFSA